MSKISKSEIFGRLIGVATSILGNNTGISNLELHNSVVGRQNRIVTIAEPAPAKQLLIYGRFKFDRSHAVFPYTFTSGESTIISIDCPDDGNHRATVGLFNEDVPFQTDIPREPVEVGRKRWLGYKTIAGGCYNQVTDTGTEMDADFHPGIGKVIFERNGEENRWERVKLIPRDKMLRTS